MVDSGYLTTEEERPAEIDQMTEAGAGVNASVIVPSMNYPFGGGEYLVLRTIDALLRLGYSVELISVDRPDWSRLALEDSDVPPFDRVRCISILRQIPVVRSRIAEGAVQASLRFVLSHSAAVSERWRGDGLTIEFDGCCPANLHIVYSPLTTNRPASDLRWIVEAATRFRARERTLKTGRVAFLSDFTRESFRNSGIEGIVLYPPVIRRTLKAPATALNSSEKDDDLVLSIGRIHPFKRLELVNEIASHLPHMRFQIVGSIVDNAYHSRIERSAPANVEIFSNASHSTKSRALEKARFMLHCAQDEPFGIAIVEGLAHGCIPIVHKSGGPWNDVVARGRFGYGFEDPLEACYVLNDMRADSERLRKLSAIAVARSHDFSTERFERGLAKIINESSRIGCSERGK